MHRSCLLPCRRCSSAAGPAGSPCAWPEDCCWGCATCRGRTVTHHDCVLYSFSVLIVLCVLFWVREFMLSAFTLPLVCCLFIPVSLDIQEGDHLREGGSVLICCSPAGLCLRGYSYPLLLNTSFLALALLISASAFPHVSQTDRTGAASSTSPGSLLPREQATLNYGIHPLDTSIKLLTVHMYIWCTLFSVEHYIV